MEVTVKLTIFLPTTNNFSTLTRITLLAREIQGMTDGQTMNYIWHLQALSPPKAMLVNSTKSMRHCAAISFYAREQNCEK
jgi:hypothetical protein